MPLTNSSRIVLSKLILILAVGLALPALRAQSIYSPNALGYVDVNFVAGSNLVANPLFSRDNTVSNLFREVPDGTYFRHWLNSGSFDAPNYYNSATGWSRPDQTFLALDGGFLVLPSATSISFVGEPWELVPGPLCVDFPEGQSVRDYLPTAFCSLPPDFLDVHKWNPQVQDFDIYQYFFGFWSPSEPEIGPAESAIFLTDEAFEGRSRFSGVLGDISVSKGAEPITLMNPQHAGGNFTLQFSNFLSFPYAVFCSSNLDTVNWQFVQRGTAATNDVTTVTLSNAITRGFYRVLSDFTTNGFPLLLGGYRGHSYFSFQFYAPVATNYVIERTASLSNPSWQTISTIAAGPSNIVSAADSSATAITGYYRIRY
jgi:hypothetical protein